MTKKNHCSQINIWPIGRATLVGQTREVPLPNKFIASYSGYLFYKTRHGIYAVPGGFTGRRLPV